MEVETYLINVLKNRTIAVESHKYLGDKSAS